MTDTVLSQYILHYVKLNYYYQYAPVHPLIDS